MSLPNTTAIAAMPRRPQTSDFKPLSALTVNEMIEDVRVKNIISAAAPKHFKPERMLRVWALALQKTPKLRQCTPISLFGAIIQCTTLGLEPNTPLQHAHLIPFERREKQNGQWVSVGCDVNVIIGYRGLIDLSRRTGDLKSLHADVVYEGDDFSYEYGSNMHLRHVPQGGREGRAPTHAYCHASLTDGQAFEVLPYADVLKIRDKTEGYKQALEAQKKGYKNWEKAPWIAYEHEMGAKTMIRRLSKYLPMSIDVMNALTVDAAGEGSGPRMDFTAIANDPSLAKDPDAAMYGDEPEQITEVVQDPIILNTRRDEPAPLQAKPPAAKASPKAPSAKAAPAPKQEAKPEPEAAQRDEPTEEDQREADRMMARDQAGEPAVADEADGWDQYFQVMCVEYDGKQIAATKLEVTAAFRDSVLGATTRKEITEARANELLAAWKQKTAAPPSAAKG